MSKTRFCEILSDMPRLRHSNDGPYDVTKSEVVAWLVGQPWALEYLFQRARTTGRIAYSAEDERWYGVGFDRHMDMGGKRLSDWYEKNGTLDESEVPLEIE